MQVWHFSEMAYHPAWPELGDSYRVPGPPADEGLDSGGEAPL